MDNLCHLCGSPANHGVYPRKPDAYGGTTSDTDGPITWWCAPCSKVERYANEWARLDPFHQALCRARFPLLGDPIDWAVKKEPSRMLANARAGAAKADPSLRVTCGRCLGSGRFSWNARTGDTCFGCGGSGQVYAKERTKKDQARWLAAATLRAEQIAAKQEEENRCRPCT